MAQSVGLTVKRLIQIYHRGFTTTCRAFQENVVQSAKELQYCYQMLQIPETCDNTEVRAAYLDLAKQYHPDSGCGMADAHKFTQVEAAYKTIIKHRQGKGNAGESEAELMDFDIRHTAPQHRQYLNNEGVGCGTPGQRQRQYQQYRISRANENVYNYRMSKDVSMHENQLVTRDKAQTRKRTIRNAIDRLVEDLITESMARGDFDNLPGSGQPLKHTTYNPMVDMTTYNLNRILIENGYLPEWAMLDKEIRQGVVDAGQRLVLARLAAGPEPLSSAKKTTWVKEETHYRDAMIDVNKKIDRLNLLVPTLWQQMVHYNVDREVQEVLEAYRERVKRGEIGAETADVEIEYKMLDPRDRVTLRQIFTELKALFSSSKS